MQINDKKVLINQKTLAKKLNLSIATVSKSLRNQSDINIETKARVLDAASRMGYPVTLSNHRTKKAKGGDKNYFLGVLFYVNDIYKLTPEADLPGVGFLAGLSHIANTLNTSLVVHRFSGKCEKILDPANQPPIMSEGMIDGLILVHRFDPDVVKTLAAKWPCVTITHNYMIDGVDHVDSDHISAMVKLIGHLKDFGHKRIGFVGRETILPYSRARFGSYCHAMASFSLKLDTDAIFNVFEPVDIANNTNLIIEQVKKGITAWVCADDITAYKVIKALDSHQINVPGQVSVTGFDALDLRSEKQMLTTVKVPFVEMGSAALARLLKRVNCVAEKSRQILINCDFVQGQTTGPVI